MKKRSAAPKFLLHLSVSIKHRVRKLTWWQLRLPLVSNSGLTHTVLLVCKPRRGEVIGHFRVMSDECGPQTSATRRRVSESCFTAHFGHFLFLLRVLDPCERPPGLGVTEDPIWSLFSSPNNFVASVF